MPQAVQLMVVAQVGEALADIVDDVKCVQITVRLLGAAHDPDRLVSSRLQFRIRVLIKDIRHRLDPFRKVTVLKYKAVKLLLRLPRILRPDAETVGRVDRLNIIRLLLALLVDRASHLEIVHTVAGLCVCNPVVERLPLVGDHGVAHQPDLLLPESICDLNPVQTDSV